MASPLLKRYLLALDRYKWAALVSFLGVFGVSAVVAMQPPPPPEFKAQGVLVQNFPLVAITATGTEVQQRGQGILSEEFLLSDVLLQQVSEALEAQGVSVRPQTIRSNTDIDVEDGENGDARRALVTLTWPDEAEAQATLNLMFDGIVELSRVTNQARLVAIIDALNARLPQVEAELRQAEQALETYDRTEGPAIQAAMDGSLLGSISGSQQQWRQNQITLAGIEAQMRSIQAQLGMSPDQAFISSALSADPILAQLRAQILESETQLQLLSADLRPAHPTIQDLQQNLQAYSQLLQQRAVEVIGRENLTGVPSAAQIRQSSNLDPARATLANQLVALRTQRDTLLQQQQILLQAEAQLRQQYSGLPNKQLERDRLAQIVAQRRALYDQIQAKRIDAQAAEAETVPSLTVAEPPSTTLEEQEPQNPLGVMAVGALLGLVAGGAVVFLLDMLDGTVRTHDDLRQLLRDQDVPLLGVIPTIRSRYPYGAALSPVSPYGDAYERFRSNLRLAGGQTDHGREPRVVLLTSTRDNEGKTLTAYNLAMASARAGRRTLIVEADLRSGSQAHQLGVELPQMAFTEPLRYYDGYQEDPIQMVPQMANLYIAPSPGPQAQAAAIIESSEVQRFLEDARGRFDLVVLDAPPLSRSNDAILLERQTDGLLLVTRPGYTEKTVLNATIEQLIETEEVEFLGAVINDANVPVAAVPVLAEAEDVASAETALAHPVEF